MPRWRGIEQTYRKFHVPWSPERYPASMKHLSPLVREKAIEIANALLEEGYPEGQAIRIGIARAKVWGERRGTPGSVYTL